MITKMNNPHYDIIESFNEWKAYMTVKNIDEYICSFPIDVQEILQKIRAAIRKNAPDAIEAMGYGVPGFKMKHYLVYFAAFKKHIGFYPTPSGIKHFKNQLAGYDIAEGTVRFPLDKPIPYELIEKIVKFRVQEESKENA